MPQYTKNWWTPEQHAFWHEFFVPFQACVRQRKGPGGKMLSYVTGQTIMNRLDDLVGPHNWEDKYEVHGGIVVCTLTITTPWGQKVTKSDCGDMTMASGEENEKGGFTDALKRTVVKFGPGRHLYEDGLPLIYEDGAPAPGGTIEAPPLGDIVRLPSQPLADDKLAPGEAKAMVNRAWQEIERRSQAADDANPLPTEPPAFSLAPQPTTAVIAKSDANLARMIVLPAFNTQVGTWIKMLSDHYGVDIQAVMKRAAVAEKVADNPWAWDKPTVTAMSIRAVAFCMRLPNYNQELEIHRPKVIESKQNTAWRLASKLFRKAQPDAQLVENDERIHRMIVGMTKEVIVDLWSCHKEAALDTLISALKAGLKSE